jgi:tRNA-2-methylthio-N6-dimethylallyladenosine synthase
VLAAMKRGYTVLEYRSIVRRLKRARPGLSLTSDFIVAFPGETAADFEATLKLVRDIGFDGAFSFFYSPRPGTPAAELPDPTPVEEKSERLQRLQSLLDTQFGQGSERMVGTTQRVLVESQSKRRSWELSARTANNRVVNFAGPQRLINTFLDLRITSVVSHTLRGELLDAK